MCVLYFIAQEILKSQIRFRGMAVKCTNTTKIFITLQDSTQLYYLSCSQSHLGSCGGAAAEHIWTRPWPTESEPNHHRCSAKTPAHWKKDQYDVRLYTQLLCLRWTFKRSICEQRWGVWISMSYILWGHFYVEIMSVLKCHVSKIHKHWNPLISSELTYSFNDESRRMGRGRHFYPRCGNLIKFSHEWNHYFIL